MTRAPLHHARQDRARHVEQAFEVRVDHPIPVVSRSFVQEVPSHRETGVVQQEIRDAGCIDQRSSRGVNGIAIAYVHAGSMHPDRMIFLEAGSESVKAIGAAGPQGEVPSLRGEATSAGLSNSRAGAGDECERTGQSGGQGSVSQLGAIWSARRTQAIERCPITEWKGR